MVECVAGHLHAGRDDAVEDVLRQHPEHASAVRALLPSLQALADLGVSAARLREADGPPAVGPGAVLGDYRIVRQVGRGGMGIVYQAVQESLGRTVALKVLSAGGERPARQVERFRREAKAAARLHHTNIVPVFGVGEDRGVPYYAMQFIDGQGLDVVLRALVAASEGKLPELGDSEQTWRIVRGLRTGEPPRGEQTDPIPTNQPPAFEPKYTPLSGGPRDYFRRVATFTADAADALHHAHRHGVLHRDVKPSNLLLDESGTVWVTDFGLAWLAEAEGLTESGDVVGTLRYMAPERFRGTADARSDVYSLGLTLYEMLTLRPAFPDEDRARLMMRLTTEPPQRPRQLDPSIPRDLERIVLKAMEFDPSHRYATAADLADDLRRWLDDLPPRARRIGWLTHAARWCRRNPVVASLTSTVALLLVLLAVGGTTAAVRLAAANQTAEARKVAAEEAQHEAKEQLAGSLLAQAKVLCRGGLAGSRGRALEALAKAAALRQELGLPPLMELRNETLACLALPDLRPGRQWEHPRALFVRPVCDPAFERYACNAIPGPDVEVRSLTDGRVLRRLRGLVSSADWLRFSSDGRRLAGKARGEVVVWDLNAADAPTLRVTTGVIHSEAMDFPPDGSQLALGVVVNNRPAARVYDLATGKAAPDVLQDTAPSAVGFRPGTGQLTVAVTRGVVRLYGANGRVARSITTPVGPELLAWRPDGRVLAASNTVGVTLWDMETGTQIGVLQDVRRTTTALAWSSRGDVLAAGYRDGTVCLWETETGRRLAAGTGAAHGLRFGSGDRELGLSLTAGHAGVWEQPAAVEAICRGVGPIGKCSHVRFDADGRLMLVHTAEAVLLWDAETDREAARWPASEAVTATFLPGGDVVAFGPAALRRWPRRVASDEATFGPPRDLGVAFANVPALPCVSGGRLGLGVRGRAAMVLDPERPDKWVLLGGEVNPMRVLPSPDGRWIVTGSAPPGRLLVWSAKGERVQTLPAGPAPRFAFSPDGRRLAAGIDVGYRVWKTDTWQEERVIALPQRPVFPPPLAFSPDGTMLAVTPFPGAVRLLDVETAEELATLETGPVLAAELCFSPDGTRLIVVGESGGMQMWDLRRARQRLAEVGHDWERPSYATREPIHPQKVRIMP